MSLRELYESDDPDFLTYVTAVVDLCSSKRQQIAEEANHRGPLLD